MSSIDGVAMSMHRLLGRTHSSKAQYVRKRCIDPSESDPRIAFMFSVRPFVGPSVYPFVRSFVRSFVRLFVRQFVCSIDVA